jgi:hypothetical protein
MICYKTGDLFGSRAVALVNTAGVMGKGIALQFKQAFPRNFGVYRKACQNGELQIGGLLVVRDCK